MKFLSLAAVLLGMVPFCLAASTSSSEIDELRDALAILKSDYNRRINNLEHRLELAERTFTAGVY